MQLRSDRLVVVRPALDLASDRRGVERRRRANATIADSGQRQLIGDLAHVGADRIEREQVLRGQTGVMQPLHHDPAPVRMTDHVDLGRAEEVPGLGHDLRIVRDVDLERLVRLVGAQIPHRRACERRQNARASEQVIHAHFRGGLTKSRNEIHRLGIEEHVLGRRI
jgi:hypothetical protein